MTGHRQVEPFLACLNIDLSVIGGRFVSDDELLTAETSPFCFLGSVPAIAAFNNPETILFVGSKSCLDFIMLVFDHGENLDVFHVFTMFAKYVTETAIRWDPVKINDYSSYGCPQPVECQVVVPLAQG